MQKNEGKAGSAGKVLPLNLNNAPTPGILTETNLLEPDAVLPVGANIRSDGELGDTVSAMGGNGRSNGERGGVLQRHFFPRGWSS